VGPIFTIFGMSGHTADVITHVKFQADQSKGLGSTGSESRVFPIDFDRRSHNSVMHYRATLCDFPFRRFPFRHFPFCRFPLPRGRVSVLLVLELGLSLGLGVRNGV